jgi:uncharacterized iron-regulated membrane protein
LIFGLLLLVQSLSGTAIVFRDELNRSLHRSALTVVPSGAARPMQDLLNVVRAAHPQANVLRIDFPRRPTDAVYFRLEAKDHSELRYLSVDPYRGTITRDGPLSAWPIQWLFELHQELLTGDTGEIVVGITGISLLLLTVTAPFVWWPGRRNLKRSFDVTLNAGSYRSYRDLHRVGGVLVVVVLFLIAITGIATVWRNEFLELTSKFAAVTFRPAPQVAARSDMPLLPIDQIVLDAHHRFGQSPVKSLRFPGGNGRVVAVYLQARGTDRPRATDQFWFNGYTGETIGAYEATALPMANRAFDWLLPIHTGQALGWLGRVLFSIAALMLSGLAITGILQWTGRRALLQSKRKQP